MKIKINIKEYGFQNNILFKNSTCEFKSGNLYVLNGENGKGKSTFLSLLSFQVFDNNVNLIVNDELISKSKYDLYFEKYVSYMTQNSLIFNDLTCIENLLFAFDYKDEKKAKEILKELKLEKVINSKASDLSEGEKQRLCFGRILYQPKEIILLDECFSSLDDENAKIIVDCIEKLAKNKIVILISHLEKEFSKKVNCFIVDKTIKIENSHEVSEVVSESSNDKFTKAKNALLKRNFKFILTFVLLFLLSTAGMVFGSIYNTLASNDNILSLSMKVVEKDSEIYVVSKENYENKKYNFDKTDSLKIKDTRTYCMNSDDNNYSLSGLFLLDDFNAYKDEIKLLSGRYPTSGDECIVSSLIYEKINKLQDKDGPLEFYNLKFSSIVGVYQENDKKILDKYLTNNDPYHEQLIARLMYGFKIESIFSLYSDENENQVFNYSIKNNEQNRKELDSKIAKYICEVDNQVMLFDNKGNYVFKDLSFVQKLNFGILISVICDIILIIVFVSFNISNYRYFLLLRTLGKSRKSMIKSVMTMFGLCSIISLLSSFVFSIISLVIINNIYSKAVGISLQFFSIPHLLFVIYTLSFAIIIGVFYLLLVKKLLPINMKKQINDLKSK